MTQPAAAASTPSRALSRGEIRLLQAYLRMMGYFGELPTVLDEDNPAVLPSAIVTGSIGSRTTQAISDFVRDHGATYGLSGTRATLGLLDAVRQEHSVHLRELETAQTANPNTTAYYALLQTKFNADPGIDTATRQFLNQVHPTMRYPALQAFSQLKAMGIGVSYNQAQRVSDAEQEGHVMNGRSFAPPGYSFHRYGLAVDISPRSGNASDWKTINRVMESYGFYSFGEKLGWDKPHHELPVKTIVMIGWPKGTDGWKQIPDAYMPTRWNDINEAIAPRPLELKSCRVDRTFVEPEQPHGLDALIPHFARPLLKQIGILH